MIKLNILSLIFMLIFTACQTTPVSVTQNQAENLPRSTEPAHFPAAAKGLEPKIVVAHLGTPWADFSLRFDPQVWDIAAFREDVIRP
jgi:hypothetical protein